MGDAREMSASPSLDPAVILSGAHEARAVEGPDTGEMRKALGGFTLNAARNGERKRV
jgi:hypothetical protein